MTEQAQKYGAPARLFHWLTVFLVAAMFTTVWVAEDASDDLRGLLMGMHKSFGIIVLGLTLLRVLWRVLAPKVAASAGGTPLMAKGAAAVHGLLYLALIGIPLSGWAFVSAAGRNISFFNLAEIPALLEKNRELAGFLKEVHEAGTSVLLALLAAHVAAALDHQFALKDRLMDRMVP